MKNALFKIAFLLFALYFLISCSAAKLSIDNSSSHLVSEDFSELTITGDKFLLEEGFKEPFKYRYKYSVGNVTYNGKTAILNSDEPVGFPKNRTVNNSNLLTLNSNGHNEKQQILRESNY